ncbi:hypothetical protein C8R43DRAFT_943490 [Mycena crocata]|nr:hypothetical protein C8R43DRAFT_943490 [Mycena crocata]
MSMSSIPSTDSSRPSSEDDTLTDSSVDGATLVDSSIFDPSELASPTSSIKGVFVRSRPTSMDGSIIDFPTEPDFSQFGLTPAPPALDAVSPKPPLICAPPVYKKRRYATSTKSLYTGTGTGTSLRTNYSPIVPLRAVRRVHTDADYEEIAEENVQPKAGHGWSFKKLKKKLVPGIFHRATTDSSSHTLQPLDFNANAEVATVASTAQSSLHSGTTSTAATFNSTPQSSLRGRTMSTKSFKGTTSKKGGKARAARPAIPGHMRPRVHSFTGYSAYSDTDSTLLDEETVEHNRVASEKLQIALHQLSLRYNSAPVHSDSEEVGIAL